MKLYLSNYKYNYIACSLAFSSETTDRLLTDGLNVLNICGDQAVLLPDNYSFSLTRNEKEKLDQLCEADVLEISDNGVVFVYFSANTDDNYVVVTSRCNSNCIMCPSNRGTDDLGQEKIVALLNIVKHVPKAAKFLTITGGEPFLLKQDIFLLFEFLKNNYRNTHFLVLTNGRVFCSKDYTEWFIQSMPPYTTVGIPIHGDNAILHDRISRSNGSFDQTCAGIHNLLKHQVNIEIRIVVNALNCNRMTDLAYYIVEQFTGVSLVNFVAMEMLGSAAINSEELWVPYPAAFEKIKAAIEVLVNNRVDVGLYNFPLCAVDPGYWSLCANSISDYKVLFNEQECQNCAVADVCGGVFAGSMRLAKKDLKRIT